MMKFLVWPVCLTILCGTIACRNGANTINEVPVINARVISTEDGGCRLMIVTDTGVTAELETSSFYHHPVLAAGNLIVIERWKDHYVYKGEDEEGKEYEFDYHESGYEHSLE